MASISQYQTVSVQKCSVLSSASVSCHRPAVSAAYTEGTSVVSWPRRTSWVSLGGATQFCVTGIRPDARLQPNVFRQPFQAQPRSCATVCASSEKPFLFDMNGTTTCPALSATLGSALLHLRTLNHSGPRLSAISSQSVALSIGFPAQRREFSGVKCLRASTPSRRLGRIKTDATHSG